MWTPIGMIVGTRLIQPDNNLQVCLHMQLAMLHGEVHFSLWQQLRPLLHICAQVQLVQGFEQHVILIFLFPLFFLRIVPQDRVLLAVTPSQAYGGGRS
jgi:hypothetical protein